MDVQSVCQQIELDFTLTTKVEGYLRQYETEDEEVSRALRFESILLGMNVEAFVESWNKESKTLIREYCEKRLAETKNSHLKVLYGWNLWAITGKKDYRLLNETIDETMAVLEDFLEKDDFDHASKFCGYVMKISLCTSAMGREKAKRLTDIIGRAIGSENATLKFQIVAMAFHQAQEGNNDLLNRIGAKRLAEAALKLAETEQEDIKQDRQLDFAVYFADHASDGRLMREANERYGDYKMNHLYADDEKNLAIAHLNDHLLIEAMELYKKAGSREKLKKATLAYEENKPKMVYPKLTHSISVEQRNKEIEAMNNYIMDVVNGGTEAILDALFGKRIDVFVSAELLKEKANDSGKELFFRTSFGAVEKDTFQNSRHTTHEKRTLQMMADYVYSNMTFSVFALIVCNGLKAGTLSYEILRQAMMERGFDCELAKPDAQGGKIGSSYFERVDIGFRDFLELLPQYMTGEIVDWRYCLTFLTTQFEGLIRDVLYKHGIPVDRTRGEGDTELIPLEGLLKNEELKELFTENDLMLFWQTFTKDGYNIRNEVAHGMYLPQEYTAKKTMLVFLCVLRLCRAA